MPVLHVLIYLFIYFPVRHVHQQDWDAAQRVAEEHSPESVPDVFIGQVHTSISLLKSICLYDCDRLELLSRRRIIKKLRVFY